MLRTCTRIRLVLPSGSGLQKGDEIRQSKRKRNCPLQQARLTYTARRRTFHVKPALPPCAASQLDFAGWALGEGRNDGSKSPQHIRAQHLVSMTFRLRGFAAAPLAGRIVMGSCCHQWTMLKLRACASAALEFERCELASSPSCELLG